MINRFFFFLLFFLLAAKMPVKAQSFVAAPAGSPLPSPEAFLNDIYHTVVDSTFDHYYLITGADTCRFVKYDYDEWEKYYLRETVPFLALNELSEKAYLSRYPYYWKQDRLEKAICITSKKADSLLFPDRYATIDSTRRRYKTTSRSGTALAGNLVFSFSLPQFTDDGNYAVIDLNSICGANCGLSLTCLFRHTSRGWVLVGRHVNWSSLPAST